MSRLDPFPMTQAQPVAPGPAIPVSAWANGADLRRSLRRLRALALPLAGAALLLGLAAVALWPAPAGLAAAAVAAALGLALAAALVLTPTPRRAARSVAGAFRDLLAHDPDALILTDAAGVEIGADPMAAGGGHAPPEATGVAAHLAGWCAEPDRAVAALLADRQAGGAITREFRRGSAMLRVAVHPTGPEDGTLLWRFTRIDRAGTRGLDALGLPLLTLGADGQALAANPAMLHLYDATDAADPAFAPLLAQIGPAAAGRTQTVALRLPCGQQGIGLVVPARDGPRDLVILPPGVGLPGAGGGPMPQDHEDIPVALVQLDAEGRIWGTNRAARNLLALSPAEDRYLWEVVEGLGRPVADWLADARAGRALNRPEVLRATGTGTETFVQIILRRAGAGAPPGALVAVVSDATELKSLEARFVQSQKMQAIGQLAGGIAHDFNNLLTAINGHCDLLLMGRDAFDPDFCDLKQIQQNANRAAALVRQLLAFSRKQTLQPEVLSVEGLLEDVVRLLTRLVGERIALRLRHDPGVGTIRADRRQLEQVIVNLVVNARDAMPMGGEIRIETELVILESERAIGRTSLPPGAYAVIRVIDTGIGIPADIIDKIFEPFFTTKRPGEGTGLGLSTAYGIVKQMGGYIFVDSVEGSGTTFSLYFITDPAGGRPADPAPADPVPARPDTAPLTVRTAVGAIAGRDRDPGHDPGRDRGRRDGAGPVRAAPATRRPQPAPVAPAAAARPVRAALPPVETRGILLLAEDEAPVRAFAARALRMQGYQVLEVEDGEQALELLADRGLAVDLFITDVIMPGLDGPAWIARALEMRPGTPVVFVSGYIEETLTEALGRTPNAVYLEKPFSLETLCRTIASQLEVVPPRARSAD